ncbi:MAG: lipopolysaccharide assembly protein LapB [Betaproteobacteria bacterium HGW-Betaproteobacteria-11]|nr:MAG: lipopolysaccharide assembly protein LapB [Betaproteobacteria bacterium HGW-Betaproteobacteria-11]
MEIELWWLLALPVFFVLGWIAARIDIKQLEHESRALPRSYFKGLNFLLNEQPDQAIEAFIEAARVDPETIEMHFALGNLFRRRGEADRAIRVHQNLIERDGLTDEQRLHALAELGQDYLKAGLLDRAEEIFLKLRSTSRDDEALKNLLEIYQQEKEWAKAIVIAESLPGHADHLWQKEIAEFRCEMAAGELLHGRHEEARRLLEEALVANRKCVRALMLLGDLEQKLGAGATAIDYWSRIEQHNPAYLALIAERLMQAFTQLGRAAQGLDLLRGWLQLHPSYDLLEAVYQAELQASGAEPAYRLVKDELRRTPTLLGLDKFLEAQLLVTPSERRADLEVVKNLIHAHTRRVARYCCTQCGFKARQFYWRCPGCGGWETYPPKRSEEFDITP